MDGSRQQAGIRVTRAEAIADVDAADWNRLAGDLWPFLRHEFLAASEASGCVSVDSGWQPRHLVAQNADGRVVGALPLYLKEHSWGEFVFDWAWANAYARAGFDYYPKLVSATPFTPATSRRLLVENDADGTIAAALLDAAIAEARDGGLSSLHVQFPTDAERPALTRAGLKLRKDCQFHWHNRGYADFDAFLAEFSSRKRKKARRDRRAVAEQGIRFRRLAGGDLDDALWESVYLLLSTTFLRRGSLPYLDLRFFRRFAAARPSDLLVVLAERRGTPVAAALFFVGRERLYGRYWGSDGHYDALHFETCYYQGIEYCIDHGLAVFEPGTQGEHKVSRGFTPIETWSAHWLAHPEFFDAIARYLDEEGRHIERYIDSVEAHSPYRRDGRRGEP